MVTGIQAWVTEQRTVVKKKKSVIVEKVPALCAACAVCAVCAVCADE